MAAASLSCEFLFIYSNNSNTKILIFKENFGKPKIFMADFILNIFYMSYLAFIKLPLDKIH